ncbi:M20/M25/M40 family metallo-hydrolase [Gaopeijia maritima]|uniref:M20/M25/M40 family metallo-hydrolase n=1 Tax=Gaopeijia maritima TaxID=3119007 RepID=A0ABU9E500_9BACT
MSSSELDPTDLRRWMHDHRADFVALVADLCRVESPSDRPETQAGVHTRLEAALAPLGFDARRIRGRGTGDHLLVRRPERRKGAPLQLLIGHSDTVWPLGTLETMPVVEERGRLRGPGTLDMKGGVAMALLALRALDAHGMEPALEPVVFVNADEEIGSPDSVRHVRRLARAAERAWVLEPALGSEGRIKTARKGVGDFRITIRGRASHAGLDPTAGISAIGELAHWIERLHALTDLEAGSTVNVGVVQGGTRANVVAAEATAVVDLRVTSAEEGERLTRVIHGMTPSREGIRVEVEGGLRVPPLERTPRNRRLWEAAREEGRALGLDLDHALAGGGSDGNTTSLYTATLDGLGCVGDGAHAVHEHIEIDRSLDRCALLARLLLLPGLGT